jgi:hypothetical protein
MTGSLAGFLCPQCRAGLFKMAEASLLTITGTVERFLDVPELVIAADHALRGDGAPSGQAARLVT